MLVRGLDFTGKASPPTRAGSLIAESPGLTTFITNRAGPPPYKHPLRTTQTIVVSVLMSILISNSCYMSPRGHAVVHEDIKIPRRFIQNENGVEVPNYCKKEAFSKTSSLLCGRGKKNTSFLMLNKMELNCM